ncbi:hypothetical protein E2605_18085 [Dysgonomonas capnocytophagoides]|uniref:Uncharacterized protein n=1 Tax=Dysgonomonas capnocytophagoides TaxID=45254 RepID=A0A4Y8KTW5_9BACT|nr:hypothetical protein [Dysgonomonas capnocytophagoides]TFD92754.1 hypothetical protein E2605_18085 [Dysgonomonas capnocytophagoides]
MRDNTQANTTTQSPSSIQQFFGNEENDIRIPWKKHGAYKVYYNAKRYFCSPLKSVRPKEDLNLINQVGILLQTDQASDRETIDKCAQLIALHRHMENTSARKRLEKWAKYVISIYLFTVLFILLLVGGLFGKDRLVLDQTVIVVLLSTTTVNIIGLGLIVLRGHFEHKKQEKEEQREISATEQS